MLAPFTTVEIAAMSLTTRPAAAADAPAIAALYLASRRAHVAFAPLAHADADVRRWIAEVLVPNGNVRVAVEGASVLGFVATSDDGVHRWVDQLYVAPARVGEGIGRRLLAEALARLTPPVRLFTFQANHGARRFYRRHGFEEIAFADGRDNEEGCPDVLLERTGAAAIEMASEPPHGIRMASRDDFDACEAILMSLPDWFGLPASIDAYRRGMPDGMTWVTGDPIVGFVTVRRRFAHAAEVQVMGVRRECHRRGIGRALVRQAERDLRADGVRLLQVKTVGPSSSNAPYARTRRFYAALGFAPLEELPDLWDAHNPCLLMVKAL